MIAINLRTEHLINPLGIDVRKPYLSWNCEGDIYQTAYEVEASTDGRVIWNSEKVNTNLMHVICDTELAGRQQVIWKVRLWNEKDEVGAWSNGAKFEMGILNPSEFVAKWINPELTCDPQIHKPASYLKTSFKAPKGKRGRLYITCRGLYEAYINGKRAGNFVLAPGTYTYDKRTVYQTYDVTDLLKEGHNTVQVILGDGWYRSCSGVDGDRNLYGEDVALFFQLEIDGKLVCISDQSWQATQNGPVRENDMQQGEIYDARLEEIENWHEVRVENFETDNFECSNTLPVEECERFEGRILITPNGETVIDYGQNLAGYIELTVPAHAGDTLVFTHGEELDENGNFTAENFQDRKRHKEGGIEQRLTFICKEGLNHYKSKFTIWGFRYARVETDIDLSDAAFTSVAVYSKMDQIGRFECSNEDVNQLVRNSIWSQKSNFCDVPTDCPTRERAAWTGDMGVFVETGIYLEDCYTVIRKWLSECRLNQYADGKIANIAPRNNVPSEFTKILAGSVGWGDACIIVPYALYKRYGDVRILEENYEMMQRWYSFLKERAKQKNEKSIIQKENPYAEYIIETGVDYGEWCEPDAVGVSAMYRPQYKITTAYYARSGRMLSEIAEILGKKDDAAQYRLIAENAAKAFRVIATEDGRIVSDRQADYVRAISFSLLDEEEAKACADALNQLVIHNNYHLNTGFLSTPSLCSVLAESGYLDTAYRLLLQDIMPSWLYAVKKGATTIWENWDGINENGEVKASLNHYSYGAICGWLFSGICGIKLEGDTLVIKPQPYPLLKYAKAVYQSPVGEIVSGWRYEGKNLEYEVKVPSNVKAKVILPDGRDMDVTAGPHSF